MTADSRSPEPEPRGSKAAESLWAFSLEIYGRPGVAPACLSLQDRRGTDVNLLLHALWCGARGHFMTLEEHQQTRRAVTPWNENVVRPLRHASGTSEPKPNQSEMGICATTFAPVARKDSLEVTCRHMEIHSN